MCRNVARCPLACCQPLPTASEVVYWEWIGAEDAGVVFKCIFEAIVSEHALLAPADVLVEEALGLSERLYDVVRVRRCSDGLRQRREKLWVEALSQLVDVDKFV